MARSHTCCTALRLGVGLELWRALSGRICHPKVENATSTKVAAPTNLQRAQTLLPLLELRMAHPLRCCAHTPEPEDSR